MTFDLAGQELRKMKEERSPRVRPNLLPTVTGFILTQDCQLPS